MSKLIYSDGKLIARRSLLVGIATSLLAAPAIVRAASIMPIKSVAEGKEYLVSDGTGWASDVGSVWEYNGRCWVCMGWEQSVGRAKLAGEYYLRGVAQ